MLIFEVWNLKLLSFRLFTDFLMLVRPLWQRFVRHNNLYMVVIENQRDLLAFCHILERVLLKVLMVCVVLLKLVVMLFLLQDVLLALKWVLIFIFIFILLLNQLFIDGHLKRNLFNFPDIVILYQHHFLSSLRLENT